MSFGKRKGGGNFLPLLKFDARSGSLHLERRVQTVRGWEKEQADVGDRFRAIFDLANAQVGWIKFPRGAAPETILVPVGQDAGVPPDEDYKEGFRLLALMDANLGGGVHEFMSTSVSAWNAVSALHDAYLAEASKHPGQAPIVALEDVHERRYASGNSFEPVFHIVGWVPRPEEFGPEGEPPGKQSPPQRGTTQQATADLDDEIPF